ncbi:AAA family ATPase [Roseococcus pinisoli]|uniref:AAA family ATPase n=1 Tax=Roseococcus pinisoli TaxID=2835040 RepID=UPI0020BFA406|nr:AAA family ATPase [Roseococcus pinisoli]
MDIPPTDRLIVVTGGPGSGKTTLIEALAASGLRTMPEAGRAIIRDQLAIGGNALPWADRAAFAELMLGWEMRSHYEALAGPGTVILDRGVPDVAGYLTLCGLEVPAPVRRAAEVFRYRRQVFIAPPWRAIFAQDAERKQDFAEAQATFEALAATYVGLGYELVHLPLAPVTERVAFVLDRIGGP